MAAFNGVVHVLKNAEIVLGFKFDELVSIVDSLVVRNDFILIPDIYFFSPIRLFLFAKIVR